MKDGRLKPYLSRGSLQCALAAALESKTTIATTRRKTSSQPKNIVLVRRERMKTVLFAFKPKLLTRCEGPNMHCLLTPSVAFVFGNLAFLAQTRLKPGSIAKLAQQGPFEPARLALLVLFFLHFNNLSNCTGLGLNCLNVNSEYFSASPPPRIRALSCT